MRLIKDTRSFFGALSLLIVGLIISVINLFYFYRDYFGDEIFMSRWWWEITLNFQILCFASMWYAYSERLAVSVGREKRMAIFNFSVGLIAVSAPCVLLLIGAYSDWFRQPASRPNVIAVHYVFTSWWVLATLGAHLFKWFTLRRQTEAAQSKKTRSIKGTLHYLALKYWAIVILLMLLLLGEISTYDFVYVLTPFLGYLQVALIYLRRAKREANYETVSAR